MSRSSQLLSEIASLSRQLTPVLLKYGTLIKESQQPCLSTNEYDSALMKLCNLVSNLKATDDLAANLPNEKLWNTGGYGLPEAPCIFTNILQSPSMSMSLFSLRTAHCQLPLHDHPKMCGFVKVLRGRIRIMSYSWLDDSESLSICKNDFLKPVAFEGELILTTNDGAITLTPKRGNVHLIEALDCSATFFDLLIPDYDPPTRDCKYYRVEAESEPNIKWLKRIPTPTSYFCHNLPFFGKNIHTP